MNSTDLKNYKERLETHFNTLVAHTLLIPEFKELSYELADNSVKFLDTMSKVIEKAEELEKE